MTGPAYRRWLVCAIAIIGIALVWTLSYGEDEESKLWRHYNASVVAFNLAVTGLVLGFAYIVDSPAEAKRRLAQVSLAGTSFTLMVLFMELPTLVGHDYGQTLGNNPRDTWMQLARGVNRRDPELIHIHHSHAHYQGTVTGNLIKYGIPPLIRYQVDVKYDGNGFRNSADYDNADIVVIGDSFVEGAEVAEAETMVSHLRRQLGVTVANLGQSNYGPQQELVVLQRYGIPLTPHVAVWCFFGGNDLNDVDAYQRHVQNDRVERSIRERCFIRNSLQAFANLTTCPRQNASPAARERSAVFKRNDGDFETQYFGGNEGRYEPRQLAIALEALHEAYKLTKSINAELLIIYIPRKIRVYKGFIEPASESVISEWRLNDLPAVLDDWTEKHGVNYLDATGPLRDAVASGVSVYLPNDVHWNATGHRVVGAAVASKIEEMGSLDGSVH